MPMEGFYEADVCECACNAGFGERDGATDLSTNRNQDLDRLCGGEVCPRSRQRRDARYSGDSESDRRLCEQGWRHRPVKRRAKVCERAACLEEPHHVG